MNGTEFKPNVQALQQDVIDLLKDVSQLMGRANFALSSEDFGQKYGDFQKQVENETRKVEKLELRMAIVAPMKAGKSTIINAIIGQDLLPSRNAAMTTLPTEIFFNANLNEPILTLDDEVLSIFKDTLESLQRKINELGSEETQKRIAQYPHLNNLVRDIKSFGSLLLKPENKGREEIKKILSVLNDIVRLCSVLDPINDPLFKLPDVPRIETPFWHSQEGEQSNKLGNLVIVDTPGPNEAGENLRLSAVVAEQLKNSSIVLIVLDFTQLNNQAAEGVKKQVKPIIDLLGKENLYVLVNKVDQRRQGDMTTEDVKKFVASDLELSKSSDTEQVFEIAAIRAFCATKFLLELQQNPDAELTELVTVESLAQEVFGIDWEEDLEDATTEELEKKALKMWKKSGFAPFLEQAINVLMETAAPRCMMSALNVTHSRLLELRDDVILRSNAIAQDEDKLRLEGNALQKSLYRLEECRNELKYFDSKRTELALKLDRTLEQLKKKAKVSIGNSFLDQDREFKNQHEAREYFERTLAQKRQKIEGLFLDARKDAEQVVKETQEDLINFLEKKTKPIIEEANNRLNKNFNINLSLPSPTLKLDDYFTRAQPEIKTQTRLVSGGYGARTVKKRSFWHWLWIVPYKVEETYKKPDVREDYYVVSLNSIIDQINYSLEASVRETKKKASEDLDKTVKVFFRQLRDYLDNYRDILKQAEKDQKLSINEKNKLLQQLTYLEEEARKYIQNSESYMKRNQQLMPTDK